MKLQAMARFADIEILEISTVAVLPTCVDVNQLEAVRMHDTFLTGRCVSKYLRYIIGHQ